jgi:hypothetical protein
MYQDRYSVELIHYIFMCHHRVDYIKENNWGRLTFGNSAELSDLVPTTCPICTAFFVGLYHLSPCPLKN